MSDRIVACKRSAAAASWAVFAWCLLAGFGTPGVSRSVEGESLAAVDRAIEFHGGSVFEKSRTRLELCSASGCSLLDVTIDGGRYVYDVEGPYRERVRRARITNDEVEVWLDGARVTDLGMGDEAQSAQQSVRDWVMARVYFCFLPYRLNDPGVYKQDLGREEWGGRSLSKIKVTFEPGSSTDAEDEYMYWLDPQTGRVEQFAYSYDRGRPGLRFRRAFNHRRVGGILFFDQHNLGAEGEGLSVDQLTPDYVANELRPVSTVVLRSIEVEPLD